MSEDNVINEKIFEDDRNLNSSVHDSNDISSKDRAVTQRNDESSSNGSSPKRDYKHLHKQRKREKKKKESKRHKRKKKKNYSDDDEDDDRSSGSTTTSKDERKQKRRRHRERKRSRKRHKYDSSESSSSDSERSSNSHHARKERKKSKKRSQRSHSTNDGHRERDKGKCTTTNLPTFGKYGILKESDFFNKQRDFEVWLSEVKQIPSFSGPKRELMNYFKEYCEDYNTATLPHEKYYNYEKWEMEEYNKKKLSSASNISKTDEMRHWEEMARKKEEKRRLEEERIRQSMNKEKIEQMKRQQLLKHELELAYKTGDEVKRRKLQKQLEPDDARAKVIGGAAHPWSK